MPFGTKLTCFSKHLPLQGILLILPLLLPAISQAASQESYSFIVAGHTYGSHHGANLGLYPKFLNRLKDHLPDDLAFIVLTGDIVRNPTAEAWAQVQEELKEIPVPVYWVLGNHDYEKISLKLFQEKFGGTFYAFVHGRDLFLILDTQKQTGRITPDQLNFIRQKLTHFPADRVFIFFHELIWKAHQPRYNHVRANFGSYDRYFRSNFWEELIPLLSSFEDKEFYLFAGDLGGNPSAWPAFYEKKGRFHLIASGMGEVPEENFLVVHVSPRNVSFELVPLNPDIKLKPLETYHP